MLNPTEHLPQPNLPLADSPLWTVYSYVQVADGSQLAAIHYVFMGDGWRRRLSSAALQRVQ